MRTPDADERDDGDAAPGETAGGDPGEHHGEPGPRSDGERRGRKSRSPLELPWKGWKDVLWRVANQVDDDRLTILASSVAFYGLLALFPTLIGIVTLYGLWADPSDVVQQINTYSQALPWTARSLIAQELTNIAQTPGATLTAGLVASALFSLFSASSGIAALMTGVNSAYDETETRGWLRRRLLALGFTAGVSLFVVVTVGTITLLPVALDLIGLESTTQWAIRLLRWPLMGAGVLVGLCILYRYGPNRTPPRWSWVICGAALAAVLWVLASLLFALYTENLGRFHKTYGTIGSVVVLLLWLFISAFAILLGAELNAELEHQTAVDSTIGPPRPMGERHAHMADTLGDPRPARDDQGVMETVRGLMEGLTRRGPRKED